MLQVRVIPKKNWNTVRSIESVYTLTREVAQNESLCSCRVRYLIHCITLSVLENKLKLCYRVSSKIGFA